MGAPKSIDKGGGSVLAFKYNAYTSQWDQYGSIEGLSSGDESGYSISLSYDGNTMAVGTPMAANLDGSSHAGKASTYLMGRSSWQILGQDVYGQAENDVDGTSVAISQDGNMLVIGGKGRSDSSATTGEVLKSTGHCRIYQLLAGQWQFLHSIAGSTPEEQLGHSVAVSSDGNVVACSGVGGARDDDSTKSGVVRLWNRASLQESTIWPRGNVTDFEGATFGTSLAISADGGYVVVGAPTWINANGEDTSSGAIQIFRIAP